MPSAKGKGTEGDRASDYVRDVADAAKGSDPLPLVHDAVVATGVVKRGPAVGHHYTGALVPSTTFVRESKGMSPLVKHEFLTLQTTNLVSQVSISVHKTRLVYGLDSKIRRSRHGDVPGFDHQIGGLTRSRRTNIDATATSVMAIKHASQRFTAFSSSSSQEGSFMRSR